MNINIQRHLINIINSYLKTFIAKEYSLTKLSKIMKIDFLQREEEVLKKK